MRLPYIAFTSKQEHLISSPEVISETDKMSIWSLTLHPDEVLLCSKAKDLFLWLISEDCKMEVFTAPNESKPYNIKAGSYTAEPKPVEKASATRLKNISSRPQKIITVEYKHPITFLGDNLG